MLSQPIRSMFRDPFMRMFLAALTLSFIFGVCKLCCADEATIRAATVRVMGTPDVRKPNERSLGTGTVFFADATHVYVLTNEHVSGIAGAHTSCEFWVAGKRTGGIPARAIRTARLGGVDVSVLRISRTDMAGVDPPFIPLAPEGYQYEWASQSILTSGCAAGRWPTIVQGYATRWSDRLTVSFVPKPAGGRSGSALFNAKATMIVGLVAWSAGMPDTDHSFDGRDETTGIGIAMRSDVVWAVLRGKTAEFSTFLDRVPGTPLWKPSSTPLSTARSYSIDAQAVPLQYFVTEPQLFPHGRRSLRERTPRDEYERDLRPLLPELPKVNPDQLPDQLDDEPQIELRVAIGDGRVREFFQRLRPWLFLAIAGVLGAAVVYFCFRNRSSSVNWCMIAAGALASSLFLPSPAYSLQPATDDWRSEYSKQMGELLGQIQTPPPPKPPQPGPQSPQQSPPRRGLFRWRAYQEAWTEAQATHNPMLVVITIAGCQPCVTTKSTIEQLGAAGELDNVAGVVLDANNPDHAAAIAAVTGSRPTRFPTTVFRRYDCGDDYCNGWVNKTFTGALSAEIIRREIE